MKKKLLSIILSCVILMSTIVPTAYALDVGIYGTPIHFNFGKTYGINVGGLLQDSLAQTAYIYQATDGLSLGGIFNYAVQFGNYNSDTSSREKYTWSSAKKKIQQDVSDAMDSYLYDQFSKAWALDLTRIRTVDTTTQQVYSFATQDYFNYTACYQSVNAAMAGGQANLAYAYQVLNSCTNSNYAATLRETWYITDVSRPQYLMNFEQTSYLTAAELTALSQYNVTNSGFISSQLGTVQTNNYVESYYQLPDGRNSYDLEPEDVWGTYFIYNATNYRSVAEDDGITLGLWHLDGNYHNDAYYQDIVPQFGSSNFVSSDYSWNGALTCSFDVIPFPDTSDYTVEFRANTAGGKLSIQLPIYKNYIYNSDGWTVTSRAQHFVNGYLVGFGPSLTSECWFDSGHTTKTLTVSQLADPIVVSGSNSWVSVSVVKEGNKVSCYIDGQKKDISFSSPDPYVYYTDRGFVPPDDYADSPRSCLFSNSRIDHKTSPECSESFTDFSKSVPAFSGSGVLDELRLSNKVLYTENYTPRTQPFDTNKVLVVPDPATMTDTTIAVKSSVPVGALRVGGIRPTFPGNGDVYVVEEKGIVKDVQQFQQDGWYSVQASLYIDGEWKLFFGFDISGFGLNKPDSSGGGTGPGGSGDSGGGSGGGSGGSGSGGGGSGFWDKLLQSTFGGVLSVLASLLSGLLTLLGAILTMLLGIVGYIGIFLPFLPGSIVTLIGGGVFIVLALVVIKFIGGLL